MLALIFDMDGVLIDSNPLHAATWLEYLASENIPHQDIESWMQGKRNDEIMRRLLGPSATAEEVHRHGAAKESLYRRRMAPQVEAHLMPGLRALLADFDHLPYGLGTNAEPANVEFLLDGAGLRARFAAVVDGHQVAHPKPAPDIYLRVAELLGVPATACVIFEDSPSGVRAAIAAGATVVGVDRSGATVPHAHLSISDFNDPSLRPYLEQLQLPLPAHRL